MFVILLCLLTASASAIAEPYPSLNGGSFSGPSVPSSSDPLISYVWGPGVQVLSLQVYNKSGTSVEVLPGTPLNSFVGYESLITENVALHVSGAGGLIIDFGTELPAWLEFDSPDLSPADLPLVNLATGEYNDVDIIGRTRKQGLPTQYGTTYRLETNSELYEGVRFGFLFLSAAPSMPFTITGFRAVVQTAPVNYTGFFSAPSDSLMESIYYAAAYTVKTNLMPNYIGAILEDRGDRISWAGDAHVAQAALMAVFGGALPAVVQNLNVTGKSQNGIASYSLFFCESVMDYYDASGDATTLGTYLVEIESILDGAWAGFNKSQGLTFFGWDDRLGSGFQNASTTESQWDYRFLAVHAWQHFSLILAARGDPNAARYAQYASEGFASCQERLIAEGGGAGNWWDSLGVHASAEALNTGFVGDADAAALLSQRFNDSTSICSLSNFNQYWIARALAQVGAIDRGAASLRLCWGAEIALGATTFWEISSPDWLAFTPPDDPVPNGENGYTSLCHPWSSGPAAWIAEHLIGVQWFSPGEVLVAPHITPEAMTGGGGEGIHTLLSGAVPIYGRHGGRESSQAESEGGGGVPTEGAITIFILSNGVISLSFPTFSGGGSGGFGRLNGTLIISHVLASRILQLPQLSTGEGDCSGIKDTRIFAALAMNSGPFSPPAQVTWSSHSSLLGNAERQREEGGMGVRSMVPTPLSYYSPPLSSEETLEESAIFALPFSNADGAESLRIQLSLSSSPVPTMAALGTPTFPLIPYGNARLAPTAAAAAAAATEAATAASPSHAKRDFSFPSVFPPFPPASYRASFTGVDSLTQGSWIGTYGSDGYSLFGYDATSDRTSLPPYVLSITPHFAYMRGQWASAVIDDRALQDPANQTAGAPRNIGYFASSLGGDPTFVVDVTLNASATATTVIQIALYFVDWDQRERIQTLALLDGPGATLNPLSPIQGLSTFGEGKWLVYNLPLGGGEAAVADFRLRVSQVRGDNGVISAITFSTVS